MLSPLISRTRSTTASMFRTLDARDAQRDEPLPVAGDSKPVKVTERLPQLERGQRQMSTFFGVSPARCLRAHQ